MSSVAQGPFFVQFTANFSIKTATFEELRREVSGLKLVA